MPIVPTGVHFPLDGGAIVELVQFVDGQGVHIGADGEGFGSWLAGAPAQQANDPGLCDTGLHLQSRAGQALCHKTRGAYLVEGEFGVRVQVATEGHHVGDELIDIGFQLVQCGHSTSCLSVICPIIWHFCQVSWPQGEQGNEKSKQRATGERSPMSGRVMWAHPPSDSGGEFNYRARTLRREAKNHAPFYHSPPLSHEVSRLACHHGPPLSSSSLLASSHGFRFPDGGGVRNHSETCVGSIVSCTTASKCSRNCSRSTSWCKVALKAATTFAASYLRR